LHVAPSSRTPRPTNNQNRMVGTPALLVSDLSGRGISSTSSISHGRCDWTQKNSRRELLQRIKQLGRRLQLEAAKHFRIAGREALRPVCTSSMWKYEVSTRPPPVVPLHRHVTVRAQAISTAPPNRTRPFDPPNCCASALPGSIRNRRRALTDTKSASSIPTKDRRHVEC